MTPGQATGGGVAVPSHGAADERATLLQLEWVRRRVSATHPTEAARIASVISAAAEKPGAAAALSDRWTAAWLAVAVHLVDRQAPVRLPDGQLRSHLRSVTNLLAALVLPHDGVATVRLDASGQAELPGTPFALRGSIDLVGAEITVGPGLVPVPGLLELVGRPEPDPEPVSPSGSSPDGPGPDEPVSPDSQPGAATADSDLGLLRDAWLRDGGEVVPAEGLEPPADTPGPEVVAALRSMRLDGTIPANRPAMRTLRADQTFDHLSLMSVLDPDRFDDIVAAAERDQSRTGRRLAAHGSYIARRFDDAADRYAALLLDDPADLDLWRDVVWALRHIGLEATSFRWVLHRELVTSAASSLCWTQGPAGPLALDADTPPRRRVIDFLEWVWSDLDRR